MRLWGKAKNNFEKVPPETRVFVLGNGPSLLKTPLELLRGEHTWAVNQVHLIYPKTTWRPTRILFAEMTAETPGWWPKIWEAHEANRSIGIKMYARDDAWWMKPEFTDLILVNACTHHDWYNDRDPEIDIKAHDWHLPQICKYGGSVPMVIQLAVMHGYSEIYLLGCDLGFKVGVSNHFDPSYGDTTAKEMDGITEHRAWEMNQARIAAHELAKKVCPIPIYNAGIGGELEVYPRVKLEDIL